MRHGVSSSNPPPTAPISVTPGGTGSSAFEIPVQEVLRSNPLVIAQDLPPESILVISAAPHEYELLPQLTHFMATPDLARKNVTVQISLR